MHARLQGLLVIVIRLVVAIVSERAVQIIVHARLQGLLVILIPVVVVIEGIPRLGATIHRTLYGNKFFEEVGKSRRELTSWIA